MRAKLFPSLLFTLALLALGAPGLQAQEPQLRGTYVLDERASDTMDQIVERGMARLGRIYNVWPISGQAKKRLEETNRPYAWVQLVPQGDRLLVKTDSYELTTPANGTLPDWERSPGDLIDVTTRTRDGRIEQSFDAEDGRRVNVFTLSPDGRTLTMDVTVTSPKLDGPLAYRLVFTRR